VGVGSAAWTTSYVAIATDSLKRSVPSDDSPCGRTTLGHPIGWSYCGSSHLKSSLGTRILALVLGLVVLVIGILGVWSYREERAEVMLTTFHNAEDYTEIVARTLRATMLDQNPAAVTRLVDSMVRASQVSAIAIYSAELQPAFQTTTLPLPAEGRQALAAQAVRGGEATVDRQPVYRFFRPIVVSKECYECHQKSDPIAGVIQVDLSLTHGYELIAKEERQALLNGAVLICVLTLVIWFFMSRAVVRPLRVMVGAAGRITAGDLSERVPAGGHGEIGELATSFNVMAEELERRVLDLEEAREKLETSIHRVAEALSSSLDISSIIQILISESLSIGHFDVGLVALVDGSTYDHSLSLSTEPDAERHRAEIAAAVDALRARLQYANPLLPAISSTRALYRATDVGVAELGLDPMWETVLIAPMLSEGRYMGQMVLVSRDHVVLSTSHRRALEFLSAQGATAVSQSYLHQRTREMAITDGLTGLFDHRYFYENLEIEMARASRYGLILGLVLLDVDHFKDYNDRVGHRGGDVLLRRLATVLLESVRETDIVARYGGEEFAVILPHTSLADSVVLAERIRVAVEREPFAQASCQRLGRVTVSIGVAAWLHDSHTVEGLVEAADAALYAAKAAGRNRVVTHDQSRTREEPETRPGA
jgi:diguanylate cyclase (GGDEF)-like protein